MFEVHLVALKIVEVHEVVFQNIRNPFAGMVVVLLLGAFGGCVVCGGFASGGLLWLMPCVSREIPGEIYIP